MNAVHDYYLDEEELEMYCEDEVTNIAESEVISAKDAFVYSMRTKGYVDLEYMQSISGIETDQLIETLEGIVIWPDPVRYEATGDYLGCFTSKQQYLRGNLIRKYERAKAINEKFGLFEATVKLLADSLPEAVNAEEIRMNLGSTWIPVKYVNDFVCNLLEMIVPPRIEYNDFLGKWTVEVPLEPNYVKNNYEFGSARMNAIVIIKHILNAKPVKVFDQIPRTDGRNGYDYVFNKAETVLAQQKEKMILDAWQDYVHGNRDIEQHLQEVYMESYGYTLSRYDGSFLELPDLNPDIKPYRHQLNAIARIVLNHNTLLAHEVGSGKTIEYMCGVHELIRMKLGKKALIVLPNTTFDSAVKTYQELYSQDKILAVYPKRQFKPTERTKTLQKMASDEYRVIFITYSSFNMLTLSSEMAFKKKEQRILDCKEQIAKTKSYSARRNLDSEMKRVQKSIEKYKDGFKFGETACFDKLGIDILVVDEAHNYKNISIENKTDNIIGFHAGGSKKADNMLEKVEYIQSIGGHVVFATGTPITNSMADLYVLQRYLQPNELMLCNIFHFNDWISTFASQTHTFEVDIDSKNYRFSTRFSKFHNLPELMSMFSDVCDFYHIENGELGLPDFDGYTDVLVNKSEAQKEYINQLAERTEDIRAHRTNRTEDNLLLITVDGRKCALDIRLVNPQAIVKDDESKVSVCARRMFRIYIDYPGTTQIAFSDISTPKEGFNIYDALKKELMQLGIPESEIVFIHEAKTEAQRNKIEARFNNGEIRILIGSTMKLGTGSNVQKRLIAVHHLDVPWRPADMVQREGRIIRQGNANGKVYVYRYCTEASFDAYTWQLLESKQRFIAQFLSGSLDSVHRDESDCADTVLSYAEIKALAIGNPLIKERVEVANKLEHAKINLRQKRKELLGLQEILLALPEKINQRKALIRNAMLDDFTYKENKQSISKEERQMFGEELLYALARNEMLDKNRLFEVYQGFDVFLPKHMKREKPYIILKRSGSNSYSIKMDGDKPLGCSKRIDYFLDHLEDVIDSHEATLSDLYKQKETAETNLAIGNGFDAEVDALVYKLECIDKKLKEEEK